MLKWIQLLMLMVSIVFQEYTYAMNPPKEDFRRGGPPLNNPRLRKNSSPSSSTPGSGIHRGSFREGKLQNSVLRKKEKIYNDAIEIKKDGNLRSYIGCSLKELVMLTGAQTAKEAYRYDDIAVIYALGLDSTGSLSASPRIINSDDVVENKEKKLDKKEHSYIMLHPEEIKNSSLPIETSQKKEKKHDLEFSNSPNVTNVQLSEENKKIKSGNQNNNRMTECSGLLEKEEKKLNKEERDNRKKVKNPAEYPWIINGHLRMEFGDDKNPSTYLGSGILISNNCVLTAAHNLWYMERHPRKISFFVGMKDGDAISVSMDNEEVSEFIGDKIAINPMYLKNISKGIEGKELWASDFGLIFLEKNLGEYIGTASYGPKDISENDWIRISGYPSHINQIPSPKKSLYTMIGKIGKPLDDHIHYNIFTSIGQSGSGVCLHDGCTCFHKNNCGCNDKENCDCDSKGDCTCNIIAKKESIPFCFAIHSYGPNPDGNIGTLITKTKYEMIEKWIDFFEKEIKWWED